MSSQPYPNPQAIFYQQYEMVRRDEVVGILLALFLGGFGIHHFYLRRTGLGILYLLLLSGRGFRALLGFIECFFMPGRVREFNAIQAAGIAASLGIADAGLGPAVQRDSEYASRGSGGNIAGLRTLRADESDGIEVLLSLWWNGLRRDSGWPYWVVSRLAS